MAENTASAKAIVKMVRISAHKVRLVLDVIRGKNIAEAFVILKFTPRGAALGVEKASKSTIMNVENNLDSDRTPLVVSETLINEGPTLKRLRPCAKGSASSIDKRTSHITVIVIER